MSHKKHTNIRTSYRIIATDYYIELCQKGVRGRKKGAAFLSYAMDGELGNYNSERFYAEAWSVSPSTAHEWIRDFNEELELFESARWLKRKDQERYVKNLTEQIEQSKSSKSSTSKARPHGKEEKQAEQIEQSKSSKDILIDNNNRRLAEDFFMIYRINNGKYTGRKDDAVKAYLDTKGFTHNQLLFALMAYKESGEKMVGAAKFLNDKVYLDYIKIRLKAFVEGVWISGEYDSTRNIFVSDDRKEYMLTPERMTEKFANRELEFEMDAAC